MERKGTDNLQQIFNTSMNEEGYVVLHPLMAGRIVGAFQVLEDGLKGISERLTALASDAARVEDKANKGALLAK